MEELFLAVDGKEADGVVCLRSALRADIQGCKLCKQFR